MMLTPTKLVAATLGGIGVIGGGVGAYYALQPESISIEKKLEFENKKLLNEGNETLWGIKLATYKKIKDTNTEIKITGDTWNDLKSWCSQKTKEEFNEKNNKLYEGIKQVCTVPTQKERLTNNNKDLSDTEDWKAKASKYPENNPVTTIKKGDNNAKELKDWCTDEFGKEYKDAKTNNDALVEKWCIKGTTVP